jgi:hypothetical protein
VAGSDGGSIGAGATIVRVGARRGPPPAFALLGRAIRIGRGPFEREGGDTARVTVGLVVGVAIGRAGRRSSAGGLRGFGVTASGSGPFEGRSTSAKRRSATGVRPSPPSNSTTSQPKTSSAVARPKRRIQRPRRPVASSRTARSPPRAGEARMFPMESYTPASRKLAGIRVRILRASTRCRVCDFRMPGRPELALSSGAGYGVARSSIALSTSVGPKRGERLS